MFAALGISAQKIVVQSFRLDEADLTANTAGTTVLDQNGQKCALIKIETTQSGFSFDTGMLGVIKTEQHPGEVWVYVPEGVKRMTITHPQLGVLRDHDLGLTVKRAKTYIEPDEYALAYDPMQQVLHFGSETPERLTFTVNVHAANGVLIGQFKANEEFNMTNQPSGIYIVSWRCGNKTRSVKFKK